MKTSELIGTALDYAVAVANGTDHLFDGHEVGRLHYSTDWSQGGPIIEREKINIEFDNDWLPDFSDPDDNGDRWMAEQQCVSSRHCYGPTPLVAAMRCFIASKLGDEVEVPQELL